MDGSQVSEKFDIIRYLQVSEKDKMGGWARIFFPGNGPGRSEAFQKLSVFHQNELGAVGRTS
jgi:hypothetical protein